MSINSCSINSQTIDAICGSRRAIIIQDLLNRIPVQPTGKAHQQHVNPDTTINLNIFRRDVDREEEEIDVKTLELPQISVTVSMNGQDHIHTLDRDHVVPMVSVYGTTLKPSVPIDINITDIKIRIK
jgi:hypothetical protein